MRGKRAAASRAERTARQIRALRERADEGALSAWEATLLSDTADGLPERLERFGRAFRDPALGDATDPQAPLSLRQHAKVRQIARDLGRRSRSR